MSKIRNDYLSLKNKENINYKVLEVVWTGDFSTSKCKIFCKHCSKDGLVSLSRVWKNLLVSCGCLRGQRTNTRKETVDLTDKKFGCLTAKRIANMTGRIKWICECDCGEETVVRACHLVRGNSKSCGGRVHKIGKLSPCWEGCGDLSGQKWSIILRGAKNRNFPVEISIEDAWDLFLRQNGKCALTGLQLSFNTTGGSEINASLDRIDSLKGYIVGNVQWVDKRINKMKMEFDQTEFIGLCRLITIKHEKITNSI